jgi:hypothetical protein
MADKSAFTALVVGNDVPATPCDICFGIGFLHYDQPLTREYRAIENGKPSVRVVQSTLLEICPVCKGLGLVPT